MIPLRRLQPFSQILLLEGANQNLLLTSANGVFDLFKRAIADGADINTRNHDTGDTPLIQIAKFQSLEMLKYAVEVCGADVDVQNDRGETALMVASYYDYNKAMYLLGKTKNRDIRDHGGEDALFHAILGRQYKTVDAFLRSGAFSENATDKEGNTPLICTLVNDDAKMVEILVRYGAKMDIKNRNGKTFYDQVVELKRRNIQTFIEKELKG